MYIKWQGLSLATVDHNIQRKNSMRVGEQFPRGSEYVTFNQTAPCIKSKESRPWFDPMKKKKKP